MHAHLLDHPALIVRAFIFNLTEIGLKEEVVHGFTKSHDGALSDQRVGIDALNRPSTSPDPPMKNANLVRCP